MASALPLGFIGLAEIVDIWLEDPPADQSPQNGGEGPGDQSPQNEGVGRPYYGEALQNAAPPGLTIVSVEQVDAAGPALQTQVASAEYLVIMLDQVDEAGLERHIGGALGAGSLPRERHGKAYDLRPLIEDLVLLPAASSLQGDSYAVSQQGFQRAGGERQETGIFMRLAARPGATARPEEVLDVLGIPFEATRVIRTRLVLERGME